MFYLLRIETLSTIDNTSSKITGVEHRDLCSHWETRVIKKVKYIINYLDHHFYSEFRKLLPGNPYFVSQCRTNRYLKSFIPLAVNSDISTIQGGGRIMSGFGSVPLSCLQSWWRSWKMRPGKSAGRLWCLQPICSERREQGEESLVRWRVYEGIWVYINGFKHPKQRTGH